MAGTPIRLEAAIGADRSAWVPPDSWAWTDLSARTQEHEAVITRGRMANQQQVAPGTLRLPMDNADGALTPRHPGSPYYPHIQRGLAVRHGVNVGDPYLMCDGSGRAASTPDHASLDITTDVAVAVTVEAPLRYRPVAPPASAGYTEHDGMALLLKWLPTGNQRSYRFHTNVMPTSANLRYLAFGWSPNGTTPLGFSCTCPNPASGPFTVAAWLDVNDGVGGHAVHFYAWRGTVDDLLANLDAAFLITREDNGGTTSVFASSAPLELGGSSLATIGAYAGGIIEARVFNGDLATGTEVANPDVSAETVGDTSFTDATGKTWTVQAAGEVTDYRPRFFGELGGSAPTWPAGATPDTPTIAWDMAGVLRRMRQHSKALDSPMRRTVGAPSNAAQVYGYWPMDDGRDATLADSPIPGVLPMTTVGLSFAADDTVPGSDPAPTCATQGYAWHAVVPTPATTPSSWRVEMFAKITPDAGPNYLCSWLTSGTVRQVDLLVSTSNYQLDARDELGAVVDSTSVGWDSRFYGAWLYWSIKFEQSGGDVAVTFNVVPLTGPTSIVGFGFGTSDTWSGRTLSSVNSLQVLDNAPSGGLSVANFTVVDGALTLGWLANADTGWRGEAATQRVARLCREQGIRCYVDGPTGSLTEGIADGVAAMGPQRSLPLLELLEECALADHGYLGESMVDDGLTYRTGATVVNQTPTLSVTGNDIGLAFAPTDDDQALMNDVTAQQPEGTRRRVFDQASIDSQGLYEAAITVNLYDPTALLGYAAMRMAVGLWPEMRYPTIPLELGKNPGLWADWIAARPGDLLEATGLPAEHPSPAVQQLLDGYVETISSVNWHVQANANPAGPWQAGVLDTDGTPDTDMRALDTDGSELDSSISDSDTSMDVAVTDGPLWTTDAAQYPLDLDVGGERVTATACSGASSPQTFTITRGVDGVAVAHAAGTQVRVWAPLLLTI